MNTFSTPSPITVVLAIPAGRVRLIASEREDTTVEVRPSQPSKKRDVRAAEQTEVEFQDGVLRVTAAEPHRALGGGSLDVTIALPAGSRLDGRAGAAALHSTGRLGDVTFEGCHQTVELAEASGARLQMHSGDITVGRLTGSAQIRTNKGDVTITEAVAGALDLRTDLGDVSIGAAAGVSATLDAGTSRGHIGNSLRNTGISTLTIKATTLSGDILASSPGR